MNLRQNQKRTTLILAGTVLIGGAVVLLAFFAALIDKETSAPAMIADENSATSSSRLSAIENQLERMNSLLESTADPPKSVDLEQRLSRVEGQLTKLTDLLRTVMDDRADKKSEQDSPPSRYAAPDPANRVEQQNALLAKTRLERRESFRAEEPDPAWSENAVARLYDTFHELPEGLNARNIECRRSTCRLEVDYADERDMDILMLELPYQLHEEMPGMLVFNERLADGTLVSEVFLTRHKAPNGEEPAGD